MRCKVCGLAVLQNCLFVIKSDRYVQSWRLISFRAVDDFNANCCRHRFPGVGTVE